MTPSASISPRPLPAFSDPGVAYIGPDSLLHVVSLDGRTNLAGTPIPLVGFLGDGVWTPGTSPDGSTLVVASSAQSINEDSAGWNDFGAVGAGPFTLTAVRIDSEGGVSSGVTLTTTAISIPLMGFVHTA